MLLSALATPQAWHLGPIPSAQDPAAAAAAGAPGHLELGRGEPGCSPPAGTTAFAPAVTSGFAPAVTSGFAPAGGGIGDDPDDPDAVFDIRASLAAAGGVGVGEEAEDSDDCTDEDEFEPYHMPSDATDPNAAKPPAWVR